MAIRSYRRGAAVGCCDGGTAPDICCGGRTFAMRSYGRASALQGYIPAYQDLGEVIEVSGTEANLAIARLQLAINRVIRGGRKDGTLFGNGDPRGPAANAATMVKESGTLGSVTNAAFASAKLVAGVFDPVTLTTASQVATATANLDAVADARGYATPDTVVLQRGAASRLFAFDVAKGSVFGIPTVGLVAGAVALGIAIAVLRKRKAA